MHLQIDATKHVERCMNPLLPDGLFKSNALSSLTLFKLARTAAPAVSLGEPKASGALIKLYSTSTKY